MLILYVLYIKHSILYTICTSHLTRCASYQWVVDVVRGRCRCRCWRCRHLNWFSAVSLARSVCCLWFCLCCCSSLASLCFVFRFLLLGLTFYSATSFTFSYLFAFFCVAPRTVFRLSLINDYASHTFALCVLTVRCDASLFCAAATAALRCLNCIYFLIAITYCIAGDFGAQTLWVIILLNYLFGNINKKLYKLIKC